MRRSFIHSSLRFQTGEAILGGIEMGGGGVRGVGSDSGGGGGGGGGGVDGGVGGR